MRVGYIFAIALTVSRLLSAAESEQAGRWQPLGYQIPDVPVVDQDGHALRFYTDLVKNQTVAIQFIFTSCTTICTPLGATFHRLQDSVSGLGRVRLISISVDPERDRPEDLRKFSDRFGPKGHWTLFTGEPVEIERLLKALRAFTQDKSTHSAMLLIGNDQTNRWTRAYGLAPASSLEELLREGAQGNK